VRRPLWLVSDHIRSRVDELIDIWPRPSNQENLASPRKLQSKSSKLGSTFVREVRVGMGSWRYEKGKQ
jgi:hypothetical protein